MPAACRAQRRPVPSGHVLPEPLRPDLVHPGGQPFRAAPGVGEHQVEVCVGHQVDDALLDVRPDRGRGSGRRRRPTGRGRRGATSGAAQVRRGPGRAPRRRRHLLGRRRLDDRDGAPSVRRCRAPPRNAATASTGPHRRGQPDPLAGPGPRAVEQRVEPLERHREVRAALRPRDRVDLVDDHRARPRERPRVPPRSARGNSDSGVVMSMSGGCAGEGPALVGGGVAGAHADRHVLQLPPHRPAACRMPASGDRRFRSTSVASALSGETYRTRHRSLA